MPLLLLLLLLDCCIIFIIGMVDLDCGSVGDCEDAVVGCIWMMVVIGEMLSMCGGCWMFGICLCDFG